MARDGSNLAPSRLIESLYRMRMSGCSNPLYLKTREGGPPPLAGDGGRCALLHLLFIAVLLRVHGGHALYQMCGANNPEALRAFDDGMERKRVRPHGWGANIGREGGPPPLAGEGGRCALLHLLFIAVLLRVHDGHALYQMCGANNPEALRAFDDGMERKRVRPHGWGANIGREGGPPPLAGDGGRCALLHLLFIAVLLRVHGGHALYQMCGANNPEALRAFDDGMERKRVRPHGWGANIGR
ncbi:hypothetical protein ACQ4PT_036683 [Festuca glaucescens]